MDNRLLIQCVRGKLIKNRWCSCWRYKLCPCRRNLNDPTAWRTWWFTWIHTLNNEGNLRRVLSVSVQGLAGVLSLIGSVDHCEGQHATSYQGSGTHSVPRTAWNDHTVTPCHKGLQLVTLSALSFSYERLQILSCSKQRRGFTNIQEPLRLNKASIEHNNSGVLSGPTNPFNGRGGFPSHCATELSPLALLHVKHWGGDGGHRLGPLCSCSTRQNS